MVIFKSSIIFGRGVSVPGFASETTMRWVRKKPRKIKKFIKKKLLETLANLGECRAKSLCFSCFAGNVERYTDYSGKVVS